MQIAELSRLIENLIRIGTVIDVDHAQKTCRVESGGLKTNWLKWQSARAGTTKEWDPPTVGEQCLVLSPSGEVANGVVLSGLFSNAFDAPSQNPDEHLRTYPDGAQIGYNHNTGALKAIGIQSALIQAANTVVFDCPQVTFTGKVNIEDLFTYENGMVGTGGINAAAIISGDVVADGISLKTHTHTGDSGGNTGTPR